MHFSLLQFTKNECKERDGGGGGGVGGVRGEIERGDGRKKESSLLTANATAGAADFDRRTTTATTTRGWMSC